MKTVKEKLQSILRVRTIFRNALLSHSFFERPQRWLSGPSRVFHVINVEILLVTITIKKKKILFNLNESLWNVVAVQCKNVSEYSPNINDCCLPPWKDESKVKRKYYTGISPSCLAVSNTGNKSKGWHTTYIRLTFYIRNAPIIAYTIILSNSCITLFTNLK